MTAIINGNSYYLYFPTTTTLPVAFDGLAQDGIHGFAAGPGVSGSQFNTITFADINPYLLTIRNIDQSRTGTPLMSGDQVQFLYAASGTSGTLYFTHRGSGDFYLQLIPQITQPQFTNQQIFLVTKISGSRGTTILDNDVVTLQSLFNQSYITFDPNANPANGNLNVGNFTSPTTNSRISFLTPTSMVPNCCVVQSSNLPPPVITHLCPGPCTSTCFNLMVNGPGQFCTPDQLLNEGLSPTGPGPCITYCQYLAKSGCPGSTANCDDLIINLCTNPGPTGPTGPVNWSNRICGCAKPTSGAFAPPNSGYEVLNTLAGVTGAANVIPSIPIGCLGDCANNLTWAIKPTSIPSCEGNYQLCLAGVTDNFANTTIGNNLSSNIQISTNCTQSSFSQTSPPGPAPGPSPSPSFFNRYRWFILGGIIFVIIIIIILIIIVIAASRRS